MVSISGMAVSLKTDLRFPITGQQGHESRNIHMTDSKYGEGASDYIVKAFRYYSENNASENN